LNLAPENPTTADLDPHGRMRAMMARAITRTVGVLCATALLAGVLRLALIGADFAARGCLAFGSVTLLAFALGLALQRSRPMLTMSLHLLILGTGLLSLAWWSGLGVHLTVLAAMAVLVTATGPALGQLAAASAALGYGVCALLLTWAEQRGLLVSPALGAQLAPEGRLLGHLFLALGSWAFSALLTRVMHATLARAAQDHERISDLLELGSDWTWETDADGRLTVLSRSFAERTGRSVEEFLQLGQPGGPQVVQDDDWAAVQAAMRTGCTYRDHRLTYRCVDGSLLCVAVSATPVEGRSGATRRWHGVSRNITLEQQARLELAQAKCQAEAASAAKSAFLATMSHEIRTPLNGVLGLTRMLQEPALQNSQRAEYLDHLMNSAQMLSGIVSDVLDLSKIEAGHLQLEVVSFDLPSLVRSAFEAFASLGRERGLMMFCDIDTRLPAVVRGDPVRVRQILANFLSNALKFTARGSIRLSARPGRQGGLMLAVSDTGPGVPSHLREQVFSPFTQADSSTTRRFGGTGLGLSICRELAQHMGGEVGVDSDGTNGSRFWAELPLPGTESLPMALELGARTFGGTPSLPLRGLTVLVAEDNPVNMLIVNAALSRLGVRVLEATDGEQAVALVRQHAHQLHAVLMDLHMPGLDGLGAARQLCADPATAQVPIYALSAAVLEHERRAAEAAGMRRFIPKPVAEQDLLRALLPLVPAGPHERRRAKPVGTTGAWVQPA
jgi:PAS domain S-box-containing protein